MDVLHRARKAKHRSQSTVRGKGRLCVYELYVRVQVRELLRKYTLAYWRTPSYNYTRYMVTVLVAILYGSIYFKAGEPCCRSFLW
jgi:hypothetical protein